MQLDTANRKILYEVYAILHCIRRIPKLNQTRIFFETKSKKF